MVTMTGARIHLTVRTDNAEVGFHLILKRTPCFNRNTIISQFLLRYRTMIDFYLLIVPECTTIEDCQNSVADSCTDGLCKCGEKVKCSDRDDICSLGKCISNKLSICNVLYLNHLYAL